MIVPPDARLKLDPQDEYTHVPEAASNYNESMYFNAFDLAAGGGVWMRIGNRANEGHAEVSCCVYLPGGEVGFIHSRAGISDNKEMNAAGMRFEVIDPFRRHMARYEGELLVMQNPLDMANPSVAFKTNPKKHALIELEFEGVSPMYGGEIVKKDGSPYDLDPKTAVFRGHLEQHAVVTGHITVDGQKMTLSNGTGYRDKSWGPRFWHSFFWYRWIPVTFNRDFGFLLSVNGRPDKAPVINGNVMRNGVFEHIEAATIKSEWDAGYYHRGFVAKIETAERSYEVTARVRSLIPLRHKAQAGQDPGTFTRISEALTEYECDGMTALGMSEFCDVVTNGIPKSIEQGHD